uniref:Uncharacterized protein n=1 Tax=Vitis vinifera TaxID=29760 RepID=F6H0D7_VITVI
MLEGVVLRQRIQGEMGRW